MIKKKNSDLDGSAAVTAEELALINRYSRKTLTADDVYTFTVILCDNEVDRDCEYFTTDTLYELAELFVGVTGIYDHTPSAKNQVARIYDTYVEAVGGSLTEYGEQYCRLAAKAYLPVCASNSDVISMLDAGIIKEVSVGCRIDSCTCSVCGEDMRTGRCAHHKGEEYGGEICYGVLSQAGDAYEWSFTAVPAQRNAGVIKRFDDIISGSRYGASRGSVSDDYVRVSGEDYNKLKEYIVGLKAQAEQAGSFRSMLEVETVKAGITAGTEIDSSLLEAMVKSLTAQELMRLKETFEKKAASVLPIHPQTARAENTQGTDIVRERNNQYSI